MIPDNTFIFKQFGVPKIFDYYEVRSRHLLQQDTSRTLKDDWHLHSVCKEVGR